MILFDLTAVTEKGRTAINEASLVRDDEITKRLEIIENGNYYYHYTNKCFKNYTSRVSNGSNK